jgi:molybdopterin synthase catalytic subunit
MKDKVKDIFVEGPISPEKISRSIASHQSKTDIGGHSIFLGQIRADERNGSAVQAIEYSTYKPMALEAMHRIREDIFQKYPITCAHVYHSLGRVNTGEICLFVFTSARHRKEAIQACEEMVERIKSELPIWGKEVTDQENHSWKINS